MFFNCVCSTFADTYNAANYCSCNNSFTAVGSYSAMSRYSYGTYGRPYETYTYCGCCGFYNITSATGI